MGGLPSLRSAGADCSFNALSRVTHAAKKDFLPRAREKVVHVCTFLAESYDELHKLIKEKQDAMNSYQRTTRTVGVPKRRSSGPLTIPLEKIVLEEKAASTKDKIKLCCEVHYLQFHFPD